MVAVGDEGGFAPTLQSEEEALDLIIEAIKKQVMFQKRYCFSIRYCKH